MCLEFCTSFEDKAVSPCTCRGLQSANKDIYPFMIDRNVLRSGFKSPRPSPVKFSSARGSYMKRRKKKCLCRSGGNEPLDVFVQFSSVQSAATLFIPSPRISRNKQNNTRLWWGMKEMKIHTAARWWSQLGSSFRTRKSGPGSDIRVYIYIYARIHVASHGMSI